MDISMESQSDDKDLLKYKLQLANERDNIDPNFEHANKLLINEIERIEGGGPINAAQTDKKDEMLFIHDDKAIKMTVCVKVPIDEHPRFNFVGKLLGPKGATLKQLQMQTMTKMSIMGRGSMKDRSKEEECRKEGGKYAHLNDPLHVKVEVFAAPWDAYSRLSVALVELQKTMQPDLDDPVSMSQREMMFAENGMGGRGGRGSMRGGPPGSGNLLNGPRGGPSRGGPGRGMSGGSRGGPMSGGAGGGRGLPPRGGGGLSRGGPMSRGGPPSRGAMSSRGGAPPVRGAGLGRGLPSRGAPTRGPAPSPAAQSYDDYGYESFSQSYDDPYGESRSRDPVREPVRDSYREMPRDPYREPPPRESTYESSYDPPSSQSAYYDYGHGSSAADGFTDAYGDRNWDGSKATAASRPATKSFRATSYSSRPAPY